MKTDVPVGTFEYDIIGNMMKKTSSESKTWRVKNGMKLNYSLYYEYYDGGHKAEKIGDMYYILPVIHIP
ncbi:hypothetical protein [Treponema sp. R6D11]